MLVWNFVLAVTVGTVARNASRCSKNAASPVLVSFAVTVEIVARNASRRTENAASGIAFVVRAKRII